MKLDCTELDNRKEGEETGYDESGLDWDCTERYRMGLD